MNSIKTVQGDVFQTHAQAIAIGLSANGRLGTTSLYTALQDRYPVFVSSYHKRAQADALTPGNLWCWQDSQPWMVGLIVAETPQGATRLRYVELAMINLIKDWERVGLRSLAIAPLGNADEWPRSREIVEFYCAQMTLPVIIYAEYVPGVTAEDDQHAS